MFFRANSNNQINQAAEVLNSCAKDNNLPTGLRQDSEYVARQLSKLKTPEQAANLPNLLKEKATNPQVIKALDNNSVLNTVSNHFRQRSSNLTKDSIVADYKKHKQAQATQIDNKSKAINNDIPKVTEQESKPKSANLKKFAAAALAATAAVTFYNYAGLDFAAGLTDEALVGTTAGILSSKVSVASKNILGSMTSIVSSKPNENTSWVERVSNNQQSSNDKGGFGR